MVALIFHLISRYLANRFAGVNRRIEQNCEKVEVGWLRRGAGSRARVGRRIWGLGGRG